MKKFLQSYRKERISQQKKRALNVCDLYCAVCSDRPGVRFQSGPGSNVLAGAWGIDSSRGFLVKIWSPVRLTKVMKLFEN